MCVCILQVEALFQFVWFLYGGWMFVWDSFWFYIQAAGKKIARGKKYAKYRSIQFFHFSSNTYL